MRKIVWIALLCLITTLSYGQTVRVVDKQTEQALEFVAIIANQGKTVVITDVNGQANISPMKDAPKIEFRMMGYQQVCFSYNQLNDKQFLVSLEPKSLNLECVVVSASRFLQSSDEVPVKVIQAKEVAIQNPQTTADLLSLSGNVFIQKSQLGGGSPMIRGFATNRLVYSVDGIRMNTAIYRSGNIQNVISLDPLSIESTEILFGPASVMYGSDAIGGVMSFQTLTAPLSNDKNNIQGGRAFMRYSSANHEMTGHFDAFAGFKKWSFLTSISQSTFGDLKMGSHGPEEYLRYSYVQRIDSQDVVVSNADPLVQSPSGYSQQNLMQKIRFKPNNYLDFQYGFHYSETSAYARYDRHLQTKNGLPKYAEWSYGPQKWMMNNLNISYSKSNIAFDELVLRLAQQSFEESRISRSFNKDTREIRTEKVDAYSLNADFRKQISASYKITYGIEGVLNQVDSEGKDEDISTGVVVVGPARYPDADWTSLGIYLNNNLSLSQRTSLQAGIRYNRNTLNAVFQTGFYDFPFTAASVDKSALTGSIGMVYKYSQTAIFSTNLSTAFRAPNVDDLGKVFDSEPGAVIVPNPDLESEYAYNVDVSYAQIIGDFLKFDVTGYYTFLDHAMVRRDFTLNGEDSIMYDGTLSQVQAIQNAAFARVYGIQAGLEVNLMQGLVFKADANYQKGIEELDDGTQSPLRHAPPFYGVAKLDYKLNQLDMMLYAMYNAEVSYENLPEEERGKAYMYAIDADGNPYCPSWYTLNFKANYQIDKHFVISAGIENITDKRYRPYSSGIVAPGRNFILGLKASF